MSSTGNNAIREWLKKPSIKPYAVAALLTIVTALQSHFDPFGLLTDADKFSGQIISRVISPFYGGEEHRGRDNILVVLYDEAYYTENSDRTRWPIAPKEHRKLIQRIAMFNPAAVFLDVYFNVQNDERRNQLATFYSGLATLDCPDGSSKDYCEEELLAPIYLASLIDDCRPSVTTLGENNLETTVFAPRYALAEADVGHHLYKLRVPVESYSHNHCNANQSILDTAAHSLYKHWCDRQNQLASGSCEQIAPENLNKTQYLQWGYAPDEDFIAPLKKFVNDFPDCQTNSGAFGKLTTAIKLVSKSIFDNDNIGAVSNPCVYHRYVSAQFLFDAGFDELYPLIANKVVMIGATDYPAADRIQSQVHGYLPGIFWHATALDNLMERGNKFFRKSSVEMGMLLELLVSACIFFVMAYLVQKNTAIAKKVSGQCGTCKQAVDGSMQVNEAIDNMEFFTSLFCIILLSVLLCMLWVFFNYSPENWVCTLALLLFLMSEKTMAIHRSGVRYATKTLSFSRYSLPPLLATSKNLSSKLSSRLLSDQSADRLSRILGEILLLVMWAFVALLLLLVGFLIFFAPAVFFSGAVRPLYHYILFLLGYMLFAVLCLLYRNNAICTAQQLSNTDNDKQIVN